MLMNLQEIANKRKPQAIRVLKGVLLSLQYTYEKHLIK